MAVQYAKEREQFGQPIGGLQGLVGVFMSGWSAVMWARRTQDAVWNRQQIANQLRSLLREYYPAALEAWRNKAGGLTRPDARKILRALRPLPWLPNCRRGSSG
jgi:hypothetical protein